MTDYKSNKGKAKKDKLGSYVFKSSDYVIIKSGARRDTQTGRLSSVKSIKK
jgi:hypothetical protein